MILETPFFSPTEFLFGARDNREECTLNLQSGQDLEDSHGTKLVQRHMDNQIQDNSACVGSVEDNSEFHPAFSRFSGVPINNNESVVQEIQQVIGELENGVSGITYEFMEDDEVDEDYEDDENSGEDGERHDAFFDVSQDLRPVTIQDADFEPVLEDEGEDDDTDMEDESNTSQDVSAQQVIERKSLPFHPNHVGILKLEDRCNRS